MRTPSLHQSVTQIYPGGHYGTSSENLSKNVLRKSIYITYKMAQNPKRILDVRIANLPFTDHKMERSPLWYICTSFYYLYDRQQKRDLREEEWGILIEPFSEHSLLHLSNISLAAIIQNSKAESVSWRRHPSQSDYSPWHQKGDLAVFQHKGLN